MKRFIALIISVANYARDVLGRFSTITSSVSSAQSVVSYAYLPGTDLLTGIENLFGTKLVSSFAYANDELGRQTQHLDTLPAAPFALTNTFGDNVRSEVVAAIMGANDHAHAYDPIGDLLAADLDGEGVFYSYDTNSNVTDLVDTKGDSVAHYEYGPFGETAAQKGSLVEVNPFHFSTKDLDVRVGLYFYGYRFLNPELGRWLNRDPIEEWGGANIYSFVDNSPVVSLDPFGLQSIWDPTPDLPGAGDRVTSPWEMVWENAIDLGDYQFDNKTIYVGHQDSGCPCERTWYCQKFIALADKTDYRRVYQRGVLEYDRDSSLPPISVPGVPTSPSDWLIEIIKLLDRWNVNNTYTTYTENELRKKIEYRNYRWEREGSEFVCRGPVQISEGPCDNEGFVRYGLPRNFWNSFGSLPGDSAEEVLRSWRTNVEHHYPF